MEVININKKVYACGETSVTAEIYRDNEKVASKSFYDVGIFRSDTKTRENNFIKAHIWANEFLEQMKEYETHPNRLSD